MKNLKYTVILLTLCLIGISSFATVANAANVKKATFQNQRDSILVLEWHPLQNDSGTLSGSFKTAVGDCEKDKNVAVPIAGFYNGNALSVSINFPHYRQVVAMTGNINDKGNKISTIWLDAHIAKDPVHKDWNTNLIGTDSYNKVG